MKEFTKLHFVLSLLALLLLIPACLQTHIRPDNPRVLLAFILGWVVQSVAWAGVLYQLGMRGSWRALATHWQRFLITLAIPLFVLPIFGVGLQGFLLCLVGIVLAEFHFRGGRWRAALGALAPCLYLIFNLQVTLAWNTAIVSVRHFNLYDGFFQRMDWTLLHLSVQNLAHGASAFYTPAEALYYCMPGVMGASIFFLCLAGDRTAAFNLAGSIAVAYYISLILFFFVPASGPFSLDPIHLPASLSTASIQYASKFNARALFHHRAWIKPVYGYFVAFPSMHIVQPLLAGWFLRRWKRVAGLVFLYCALLMPSILILEWHYATDIVGGILVAILAAWLAPISLAQAFPFHRPHSVAAESAQPSEGS
jgi:PAP2 superfamily